MVGVILIVLLPIIAIAYLGILNVEKIDPERCSLPVPLNCQDHVVLNDEVKIVLLNGGDRGIRIKNITATSKAFRPIEGGDANHKCSLAVSERDELLRKGERKTYTLNVSTETGVIGCPYYDTGIGKNSYMLDVEYAWADRRNLTQKIDGEIFSARPE